LASDFQVFYLLCFHLLFYYYYYFFFAQLITPNRSTQSINTNRLTHNQHKWINTTDQKPNKYTLHGKPTIATHNPWQTHNSHPQPMANPATTTVFQTHNPQQLPTTHDKPSHNHSNPKTPPTTTVNPQKSQTQNNQKIKKETRSDRRDCEPNATTAKPTSSC
jgi:hypothetical protein